MKIQKCIMVIGALAAVILAAALSGCSEPGKYKIGVSQCSSDDWRSKMNEEIMREAMFHDNVEVEILSADDSSDKQIADLDHFVSAGCDIIIVAPNEADALTPKIKEIFDRGMPVIVFDRTIHGDSYTAFQGADNREIGRMAAAVAGTYADGPRILEIKGLKGSSPAELRNLGFREAADSAGFVVLGSAYGNWNYEEARIAADSLLDLYPETNVIYCHNDRMAIGASEIAKAKGRDEIKVIGVDAAPTIGLKAVEEGKIDATFIYPTDGHRLIRTAMDILEGRPYERTIVLPNVAPVDASNARILLMQDNALREETDKISRLQGKMSVYLQRYDMQTHTLYVAVALLVLLAGFIFVLLRSYWASKRHRMQMESRNEELARQRDELDSLYHQLQEATGSKLTFFTNVSHDLRTPLTLIANPIDQLVKADNLTPRQHTLMDLASKNIKRLQRLINQILDIRKYDNGQLKLNLVNINLTEAMREWTAPFADMAARRHIRFSTALPQKQEIVLAIDVEKTERILFNLLSNAFKFTPENGSIGVTLESDGDNAVIRVSDTGIGIPTEDINNIFERFFKTDRINPNGSGIGLALSKVFIDMHGGSISVESVEGKGTEFTVKFPLRQVSDMAVAQSVSGNIDVSEIDETEDDVVEVAEDTPTILVVDDNKEIGILVKSLLAGSYTVISASSGTQAIRLATRYVPDLVICDVMMPGMSGYEVCRALKKESLTSHIPVLLLTACTRDEQRTEGYECGADGYMSKPFDSEMLVARCKSLLENRRRIYDNIQSRADVIASPAGGKSMAVADTSRPKAVKGVPVEDEFLHRFISIVEREMGNSELSVENIADELGISRVQMYRKIKALTNYSAAEMIRNIRLKVASNMLKTSTVTVSEVAYAVGFSSPSYFSRCYKDYYGESPVETQNRTSKIK